MRFESIRLAVLLLCSDHVIDVFTAGATRGRGWGRFGGVRKDEKMQMGS